MNSSSASEYTDHKVVSGNYGVTTSGTPNCRTAAGASPNNGFTA